MKGRGIAMADSVSESGILKRAIQTIARETLSLISKIGISDEHHFFMKFHTRHPGVVLPEHVLEQYPADIAVVLHRQFEDLVVYEDHFDVTIKFQKQPEHIRVPYVAITEFWDPISKSSIRIRTKAPKTQIVGEDSSAAMPAEQFPESNDARILEAPTDFDQIFVVAIRDVAAKCIALLDSRGTSSDRQFAIRFSAQYPGIKANESFKSVHEDQTNANFLIPQIQLIKAAKNSLTFLYFSDRLSVPYDAITLIDTSEGSISLGLDVAGNELRKAVEQSELRQSRGTLKTLCSALSLGQKDEMLDGVQEKAEEHLEAREEEGQVAELPSSDGVWLLSIFPARVCAYVGSFYLAVFLSLYLVNFGFDTRFLFCISLMQVDPACVGQTSDIAILQGLTHPFPIHILPWVLFYAIVLFVFSLRELAMSRSPRLKEVFNAVIVLKGFFLGYVFAKPIVGVLNGTDIALQGYIFNSMCFFYIYLLYGAVFFLRQVIPGAKANELEYSFIFDSIFALGAAWLFAIGFDKEVDRAISGAIFIVCTFVMMLAANRLIVKPSKKMGATFVRTLSKLSGSEQPSPREVFRAFFIARQECKALNTDQLDDILQKVESEAEASPDAKFNASLDKGFDMVTAGFLTFWFVPCYFAFWLLLKIIFDWVG